ncbi:hypothetical protein RN629_14000 [Sphingomonadaceae bacterium jetA1]|jgi:hypothetical protein|uniref:hypothetical protein n=1 Tax=Facivitalis istanbulensis TaxID=3075838 RepID=UPI003488C915
MLVIVLLTLMTAMVCAMRFRGPWYDEFYTLYVTRPGIPLSLSIHHWLADNHPPLFYALVRATAWLGDAVEARRAVNLMLFSGAGVQIAWRLRPAPLRRIGWVYAIAIAGAWPAIQRAAELRSNYLAFASAAVAVAALVAFDQYRARRPRLAWAMMALALLVAFNVHLAASIMMGGVVGAAILRRLLARDRRAAASLISAAMLAALPMLGHLALSFTRIEANTRQFWIQGGVNSARWAIETEVFHNLTGNIPVTLAAMIGTVLLARAAWRGRRLPPEADMALTLLLGWAMGCALLVALHLWRPFIIDRYLVALHPPLAMVLALGATALLDRLRGRVALLLYLAMTVAALATIRDQFARTIILPSWYDTGRAIATIRGRCPATRVQVDLAGNRAVLDSPPADNARVMPFAYAMVARRMGFPLASPADHSMDRHCPTLFWTEHVAGESVTADGLAAPLRAAGFPIGPVRLLRLGDGHVLMAWPQDPSTPLTRPHR